MKLGKGKFYLAAAFVLAGSSVVTARYISGYLEPFTTTFMSLAFASLTALLFYGTSICRTIKKLSRRHLKILILQSVFGIFLFRVFLTFGLQHTTAVEAGVIMGTSPALTALLTRLILRERLSKTSVIGIFFTLSGILLLQGFPFNMGAFNINHLFGNLLALCAASCEALFTALSRKVHIDAEEDYELHPFAQSGIVILIALALCFIPMLLERPFVALAILPVSGWAALVWYGSAVTVIAFACMFTGAKYCDGYTIAAFTGLIPISALVLSLLILKESVNANQLIGCGFIVISILLMSLKEKQS